MRRLDDRGFTLAELLVTLAMLAVILGAVLTLQQQGQATFMAQSAKVDAQQNARVAMDLMTRELRSANSITAIAATDITFVDQSGATTIRYFLNSGNLDRVENGVNTTLIGGVQALTFTYADATGAVTATAASVASIGIRMTALPAEYTTGSASQLHQPMVIDDRIRLRNML